MDRSDALLIFICIVNLVLICLLIAVEKFSEPKIAGILGMLGILIGCSALLVRRRKGGSQ